MGIYSKILCSVAFIKGVIGVIYNPPLEYWGHKHPVYYQEEKCPDNFIKVTYRVSQKTWEFSDEFDIVFSNNSLI